MFYRSNGHGSMPLFNVQLITRDCPALQNGCSPLDPYFLVDPIQGIIMFGKNKVFSCNNVLPMHCPQDIIFDRYLQPTIDASFEGYNVSVVAFGQSGSGKTYTIFGPGLLYTMNESNFGVLPRALRHIFQKIQQFSDRRFSIQASFLEIFGEEIHDLLSLEPFQSDIGIKESPSGEVEVVGATKVECLTIDDVFNCLETGLALRHTPSMDPRSVSSHGIFTLFLKQYCVQDGYLLEIHSKLHFVDLAASDNLCPTNNSPFMRPGPDVMPINSGLLALSNVIAALGDPRRKASHIPYWDSKLTSILRDSFGGNSLTVFVACISSFNADLQGCVNTLQLAARVANILNSPVPNVRVLQFNENPLNESNNQQVTASKETSSQTAKLSKLNDELFRLRFAVSQWQLLVTNAESLLTDLSTSEFISKDVQHQIMSWLCMKEEFAHCIDIEETPNTASDSVDEATSKTTSIDSRPNFACVIEDDTAKGLHVIEEVSEPTPTCESDLSDMLDENSDSSANDYTDDIEKLDELRQKFRETTDSLIADIEVVYDYVEAFDNVRTDPIKHQTQSSNSTKSLRFQIDEAASFPSTSSTLVNKSVSCSLGSKVSNFDKEVSEIRSTRKISSSSDTDIRSDSEADLFESSCGYRKSGKFRKKLDKESIHLKKTKESRPRNKFRNKTNKSLHPYQSWPHANSQAKPVENRGLMCQSNEEKNFLASDLDDVDKSCSRDSNENNSESITRSAKVGQDSHTDKAQSIEFVKIENRNECNEDYSKEFMRKNSSMELVLRSKNSEPLLSTSLTVNSLKQHKWMQTSLNSIHTDKFGATCDVDDIFNRDADTIRKEIRSMRLTRDLLVEQRQEIDERNHRGLDLTSDEERRMLELDEAIEAIDAAIEFKNEIICSQVQDIRLDPEDLAVQLMSLTHRETRSLLCKYVRKVIDLREGAKKMEQQYAELESQYDEINAYARKLSAALKHVQLRMERRHVSDHSDYVTKAQNVSRQRMGAFGYGLEEDDSIRKIREEHEMMERKSRDLRKHLRELLATSSKTRSEIEQKPVAHAKSSVSEASVPASGSRMPSLRGLQAVQALHEKITGLHRLRKRQNGSATTTTVTREKNKLIIKRQPVQGEERDRRRYK